MGARNLGILNQIPITDQLSFFLTCQPTSHRFFPSQHGPNLERRLALSYD